MTQLDELEFETLQIDRHGALAVLTVNRPKALNALNSQTLAELGEVIDLVSEDPEIGALIVTGGGDRAFVAGADISEFRNVQNVYDGRELSLAGQDVMHQLSTLAVPTVAAIGGFALGGGLELALACDVRVASRSARLGLPEVSLGLIPGFGGTQRLARLVGAGRALDLMLTGRQVPAEEALALGLVNYVADDALEKAREVAQSMLAHGPVALSLVKEAVRRGLDTSLEAGLEIEADLFGLATATSDFREGVEAFLGKRKAVFRGE